MLHHSAVVFSWVAGSFCSSFLQPFHGRWRPSYPCPTLGSSGLAFRPDSGRAGPSSAGSRQQQSSTNSSSPPEQQSSASRRHAPDPRSSCSTLPSAAPGPPGCSPQQAAAQRSPIFPTSPTARDLPSPKGYPAVRSPTTHPCSAIFTNSSVRGTVGRCKDAGLWATAD
jgi:hypothetical protein